MGQFLGVEIIKWRKTKETKDIKKIPSHKTTTTQQCLPQHQEKKRIGDAFVHFFFIGDKLYSILKFDLKSKL